MQANKGPDWLETFDASVTVMDLDGNVLYMNDAADKVFKRFGGRKMIGANIKACHKESSLDAIEKMLETEERNVYTIEKNSNRKMVYQGPWFKDGKVAGLVSISMFVPEELEHHKR